MTAPISVRRELGDWMATCDETCASPLSLATAGWGDAYETALGHACLHHPRPCSHELGWHEIGKPEEHRCLDCGTALPVTA